LKNLHVSNAEGTDNGTNTQKRNIGTENALTSPSNFLIFSLIKHFSAIATGIDGSTEKLVLPGGRESKILISKSFGKRL